MNAKISESLEALRDRLEQTELDEMLSECVFGDDHAAVLTAFSDDDILEAVEAYGEEMGESEEIIDLASDFVLAEVEEFRSVLDEDDLNEMAASAVAHLAGAAAKSVAKDFGAHALKKGIEAGYEKAKGLVGKAVDKAKSFFGGKKKPAAKKPGRAAAVSKARAGARAKAGAKKGKLKPGEKMVFGRVVKVKPGAKKPAPKKPLKPMPKQRSSGGKIR